MKIDLLGVSTIDDLHDTIYHNEMELGTHYDDSYLQCENNPLRFYLKPDRFEDWPDLEERILFLKLISIEDGTVVLHLRPEELVERHQRKTFSHITNFMSEFVDFDEHCITAFLIRLPTGGTELSFDDFDLDLRESRVGARKVSNKVQDETQKFNKFNILNLSD